LIEQIRQAVRELEPEQRSFSTVPAAVKMLSRNQTVTKWSKDLVLYRMIRANETLEDARILANAGR
jgi:hypothetical protein